MAPSEPHHDATARRLPRGYITRSPKGLLSSGLKRPVARKIARQSSTKYGPGV